MTARGVAQQPKYTAEFGENWRLDAACRGADTNLFFPESKDGMARAATGNAARVSARWVRDMFCAACPVQNDCLTEAIANGEHGVWGGITERQRNELRRARRHNRSNR